MKKMIMAGLVLFGLLQGAQSEEQVDTLVQVSSLDALLSGAYDGVMTFADLKKFGTAGIGTFDRLDGEMLLLDGMVYQMKSDGSVVQPEDSMTTPFAAVCSFRAEEQMSTEITMDYEAFKAALTTWIPQSGALIAFKVDGSFHTMKTRVVPGQQKPYPPLSEVAKTQPEFECTNVTGTLVGVRFPSYMSGVNMAGYHFHFLSEDRQFGGHVLAFEMNPGARCEANLFEQFLMKSPPLEGGLIQEQSLSRDQFDALLQQVE
ncbi:MAG: acetolactate decarboxylase [Kiritimatiellae bacterium]|nr:acetolactate decarboxylase [Kiritimatiellia bacterium]MDD4734602.1 acetolactate decarboxylase [Kiritimatiellia bacterium]